MSEKFIPMKRYERLRAWKSARQLVLEVYQATARWPSRELYGLTSQARRAAISISANLAEGAGKRSQREFHRFLDIALGSLSELHCLLILAKDLSYLQPEAYEQLGGQLDTAGKQIWRLYLAVRKNSAL